jgi:hypothetical protein
VRGARACVGDAPLRSRGIEEERARGRPLARAGRWREIPAGGDEREVLVSTPNG